MRPKSFERMRTLPVVGRAADWGMGPRAASKKTKRAGARIAGLKATESICPYCAVGCGQVVYTRDGELVDIEGNPRSPINQGTLCPKGSASRQLVQQPGRLTKVSYRRPGGTEWEELELETAMDMIAQRLVAAREDGWQDTDDEGCRVAQQLADLLEWRPPPEGRDRCSASWVSTRCARWAPRRAAPGRRIAQALGQLSAQRRLDHPAGELGQQPARVGDLLRAQPLQGILERPRAATAPRAG